jgi:hypothetical protein
MELSSIDAGLVVQSRHDGVSFFADTSAWGITLQKVTEILHEVMPSDLQADAPLPGVRPLSDGHWLCVDEAYAAQMAYRRALISRRPQDVIWQADDAREAVAELYDAALDLLPDIGFTVTATHIMCPDGTRIVRTEEGALHTLGRVVQEDLCIMQKKGDEHVLTAAVLCFPASWTLAEKAGRPLSAIHKPVEEYDADLSKRVQRLFDGVQAGRPLWRNNMVWYDNPDLFQPRSETEPHRLVPQYDRAAYRRAERQCIVRLPKTRAVIFSIHSYLVRNAPASGV